MGQPQNRQPYAWLRVLLAMVTMCALGIGAIALHYVEARLVAATGETLSLAAAEIADKLSRVLYERYGDVAVMARTFSVRANDRTFLTDHLSWMRKTYTPFYQWLAVTDDHGRIVAATDPTSVGQDMSHQVWFQSVRDGRTVHVGDVQPDVLAGGMEAVSYTAPIMPDGGQLTIRTRNVDSSSGQADSTSSGLLEASVLLEFSDTGCGMDAETKARIFEPFITTEELGKGRWLGLAPVHGIVQQNGGLIAVDSTPGKGTTVRIYLRRIVPDAETGTATVGGRPAVSSQGRSRRSR